MTEPEMEEQEKMAAKPRNTAPTVFVLVDENGNEFVTKSPVARYNLLAQGYTDKDPAAAKKLATDMERKASDPVHAKAADPTTYRSTVR